MPRFPLKSSIPSMQESNKENSTPSRRMNLTLTSLSSSSLEGIAATVTPKLGSMSMASTALGKTRHDAGSLLKGNFGKSVFSAKQSNGAGIGLKMFGTSSTGVSSTPNKKRTFTHFLSEKISLAPKTAQPQPAFSLKPPLQAKMQTSKTQMMFGRTGNSAKTQPSSFTINKPGSRSFVLTLGKVPSSIPSLPNGGQKRASDELKMASKTLPPAKKSTTLRVAGTVVHQLVLYFIWSLTMMFGWKQYQLWFHPPTVPRIKEHRS